MLLSVLSFQVRINCSKAIKIKANVSIYNWIMFFFQHIRSLILFTLFHCIVFRYHIYDNFFVEGVCFNNYIQNLLYCV